MTPPTTKSSSNVKKFGRMAVSKNRCFRTDRELINRDVERWKKLAEKLNLDGESGYIHARWFEEWLHSLESIKLYWSISGKQDFVEFASYYDMLEFAPSRLGNSGFEQLQKEILFFFEWKEFKDREVTIVIDLGEIK